MLPPVRRALGRALSLLLAAAFVLGGMPAPAHAHGVLRASSPASGARLAAAPRQVRLVFSEAAELGVAAVELRGPGGVAVALSPLRHGDSTSVIVAEFAETLAAGIHEVRWQVLGRDGHPVRGTFRFTILPGATGLGAGAGTAAPVTSAAPLDDTTHADSARDVVPDEDPAPPPPVDGFDAGSPLYAAIRWFGFAAMLALVGVAGFALVVLPAATRRLGGATPAFDPRIQAAGLVAAALLLAAVLARLAAQWAALQGGELAGPSRAGSMVGSTLWGRAWLLHLASSGIALAGFAMLRRARRVAWAAIVLALAGSAVAMALSGHAAASPVPALAVTLDAIHVLAAGGWLGTLLVLVTVAMRSRDARGPVVAALVTSFSPLALACAFALGFTGLAAAWTNVGSIAALAGTDYGQALLVKLALLMLVVALGAWNWRRVRPTLVDDASVARVRHSSVAELLLAAAVLGATAVLVATPTPISAP